MEKSLGGVEDFAANLHFFEAKPKCCTAHAVFAIREGVFFLFFSCANDPQKNYAHLLEFGYFPDMILSPTNKDT